MAVWLRPYVVTQQSHYIRGRINQHYSRNSEQDLCVPNLRNESCCHIIRGLDYVGAHEIPPEAHRWSAPAPLPDFTHFGPPGRVRSALLHTAVMQLPNIDINSGDMRSTVEIISFIYYVVSLVYPAMTLFLIHGPLSIANVHTTVISLHEANVDQRV
ncbi:hypothetical protein DXG01_002850 [Tephrocybe rancida]|nr:hypothetical protein DXG01_002850 [Tephrocybe rancida]